MTSAAWSVGTATVAACASIGIADLVPAGFVLQNSARVGVPRPWSPCLGALELAGSAGILVGLAWLPWIGVAAGVGLTAFFVGAVIAHVRARVLSNLAFPGAYLALSAASTLLIATM